MYVAAARHSEIALLVAEADVKSLAEREGPLTTSADLRRGLGSKESPPAAGGVCGALSLSLEAHGRREKREEGQRKRGEGRGAKAEGGLPRPEAT
jgi:hypothetical protein